MNLSVKNLSVASLVVIAMTLTFGSEAEARGKGGGGGGKRGSVNVPGTFTVQILNGSKIGVVLTPGSDADGLAPYPYMYKIKNSAGSVVYYDYAYDFTQSRDPILDGIISGLDPLSTYYISLTTSDSLGNVAETAAQTLQMPANLAEVNAPMVDGEPRLLSSSLFGAPGPSMVGINVDDDTAVDHVEYILDNGAKTGTIDKGIHIVDRLLLESAGEQYRFDPRYTGMGSTITVQFVIYDVLGNVRTDAATLIYQ